ncbi:hypothetical protein Tco_1253043 [Tanacetum coccineum]
MHQPWRTFAAVINRCISRKSTGLDRLRPSRAQILWGMFYKDNVDFVALLKMINLHTIQDDSLLAIKDSKEYKIYLAYATGAATPKKSRKFKKIASPSKKQTLVLEEEPAKKPNRAKHPEPAKKSAPAKKDGDSGDEANEQGDDEDVLESDDDHEQADDEQTESEDKEEETQDDEYLYGDVNISLINVEPVDKEKGDVKMTNTEIVDADLENVNQEGTSNQVKDDAQATQKNEVSLLIPCTSSLLCIPVSVIPKHNVINPPKTVTTASVTTISSLLSSLFPHLQQLTPIPTPTTTEAKTSNTIVPDSETLSAFHQRITNLEKDVKELKTVDHSAALLLTIKSEVLNAVKEYLVTSLDDALYKVLKKHDADIIKEHPVLTKIVERLRQQYVPNKSTEDIRKNKMDHDEDAMDEGVADKLKKRKPDDADKDEGPSAGSDRGLKRRKTSKDTKPSKKAKSTKTSKGTSKSQPKSTNKSAPSREDNI